MKSLTQLRTIIEGGGSFGLTHAQRRILLEEVARIESESVARDARLLRLAEAADRTVFRIRDIAANVKRFHSLSREAVEIEDLANKLAEAMRAEEARS